MKILVFGRGGQVASDLAEVLKTQEHHAVFCSQQEVDFSDFKSLEKKIDEVRPEIIINAAAYTQVDKAETDEKLCRIVNAEAVGVIGACAKKHYSTVIHYSTDYVFSGEKAAPYLETDVTNPLNIYGRTKLEGERYLQQSQAQHFVLRVSWVYGRHGNNFYKTMLRLGAEREILGVVADQVGSPCWSFDIAQATGILLNHSDLKAHSGVYHMTSAGQTSWHGFAQAIFENSKILNSQNNLKIKELKAISTSEYPMPAKRPLNSLMNSQKIKKDFDIELPNWQDSLQTLMKGVST